VGSKEINNISYYFIASGTFVINEKNNNYNILVFYIFFILPHHIRGKIHRSHRPTKNLFSCIFNFTYSRHRGGAFQGEAFLFETMTTPIGI